MATLLSFVFRLKGRIIRIDKYKRVLYKNCCAMGEEADGVSLSTRWACKTFLYLSFRANLSVRWIEHTIKDSKNQYENGKGNERSNFFPLSCKKEEEGLSQLIKKLFRQNKESVCNDYNNFLTIG